MHKLQRIEAGTAPQNVGSQIQRGLFNRGKKMNITYKFIKDFSCEQLQDLFLSVDWLSGNYPQRLKTSLSNSATVISAWDGNVLVGLINALDDGELTAYAHYLLVNPKYQHKGIGSNLIEKLKIKYEGYLYLILTSEQKETVAFYNKLGFEICEGAVPMVLKTL